MSDVDTLSATTEPGLTEMVVCVAFAMPGAKATDAVSIIVNVFMVPLMVTFSAMASVIVAV